MCVCACLYVCVPCSGRARAARNNVACDRDRSHALARARALNTHTREHTRTYTDRIIKLARARSHICIYTDNDGASLVSVRVCSRSKRVFQHRRSLLLPSPSTPPLTHTHTHTPVSTSYLRVRACVCVCVRANRTEKPDQPRPFVRPSVRPSVRPTDRPTDRPKRARRTNESTEPTKRADDDDGVRVRYVRAGPI